MEIYDFVMIGVLIGAMFFGAVKGFAWQLASIASIVASYFVALKFREPFSRSISLDPPWNRFLAMLIIYVATALLIWVGFRMISRSIDRMKLREFDRHIGAVFGLIKGGLYCVLITLFAVTLAGQQVRENVVISKSGRYIASVLDRSESVIPPEIHEIVDPYLQRFNESFENPSGAGSLPYGAEQIADTLTPLGTAIEDIEAWSPSHLQPNSGSQSDPSGVVSGWTNSFQGSGVQQAQAPSQNLQR